MIPFELAEPTSIAAAVKLLNPDNPTIAYKRELLRVYVRRTVRAALNAGACP